MLTYAVGDLHGCADLLRRAVTAIRRHVRGREFEVVFLGDYIDRGPDSRSTLELLSTLRHSGRLVCLLGNHEQMLLSLVRTSSTRAGRVWLANGGAQTLVSYGLDPADPLQAANLPTSHIGWLSRRPTVYPTYNRVFVHAGLEPEAALQDQDSRDLLWIRERFLAADPDDFVEKRHIVHGHTPVWEGKPKMDLPEFLPHRTNLDTGAYETGLLSIGVFSLDKAGPVDLLSVT